MEERTRLYLRGRFRDHYRRADATPPPDAERREWGYIPWTPGPDTTMVRHRALLDLGDLGGFLERERPRHVYFSAGRYDDPGAGTMGEKGWRDSDLVFDLDADHLPDVTLGEDSYAEMLAKCKDALRRLLDFLDDDFGFSDLTVCFSGGRGYHVHVRDDAVRDLESDERREIVDYVRGTGLELDAVVEERGVGGEFGRSTPTEKKVLPTDGGWGRRIHRHVCEFVEDLRAMDDDEALAHLQSFDGIGEGRAETLLGVVERNHEEIRRGNLEVHGAFPMLVRAMREQVLDAEHAHIDEPVTTDVNRLIRLPGSLHGGSGLAVRRVARDDLADFDPLTDAIPETFRGHEIAVEVADSGTLEFDGETFSVEPGKTTLPEYAGVFLMARGRAEKAKE
jgi:DNA primase small subunit